MLKEIARGVWSCLVWIYENGVDCLNALFGLAVLIWLIILGVMFFLAILETILS